VLANERSVQIGFAPFPDQTKAFRRNDNGHGYKLIHPNLHEVFGIPCNEGGHIRTKGSTKDCGVSCRKQGPKACQLLRTAPGSQVWGEAAPKTAAIRDKVRKLPSQYSVRFSNHVFRDDHTNTPDFREPDQLSCRAIRGKQSGDVDACVKENSELRNRHLSLFVTSCFSKIFQERVKTNPSLFG